MTEGKFKPLGDKVLIAYQDGETKTKMKAKTKTIAGEDTYAGSLLAPRAGSSASIFIFVFSFVCEYFVCENLGENLGENLAPIGGLVA